MTVVLSLLFVLGAGAWLVSRFLTAAADRLARRAHQADSVADGAAIDVTPLLPRIRTVRADFPAQSSSKKQESPYHEQLMESARRAISRMAFFQSRQHSTR